MDNSGFDPLILSVNPKRDVGGCDEGVAGHQKHCFSGLGGLEDEFAVFFLKRLACDGLDFLPQSCSKCCMLKSGMRLV
jgi:hypothetical protein